MDILIAIFFILLVFIVFYLDGIWKELVKIRKNTHELLVMEQIRERNK